MVIFEYSRKFLTSMLSSERNYRCVPAECRGYRAGIEVVRAHQADRRRLLYMAMRLDPTGHHYQFGCIYFFFSCWNFATHSGDKSVPDGNVCSAWIATVSGNEKAITNNKVKIPHFLLLTLRHSTLGGFRELDNICDYTKNRLSDNIS